LNEEEPTRLNTDSIFHAAPSGTKRWDKLAAGLYLLYGKKAATYYVIKRIAGTKAQINRRIGVARAKDGSRPDAISVEEARAAARAIIKNAEAGMAPEVAEGRAAADAKKKAATTFKGVAEAYLADNLEGGGARLASKGENARKLKVDLVAWHDRPIKEIAKAEIRALVRAKANEDIDDTDDEDEAEAKRKIAAANRLLSFIKRVFVWAENEEIIEVNPALSVKKVGKEVKRKRNLEDNEIRLFWKACGKLGDPAGRLFKLCLVTGQRRGEVAGLRRSELGKLPYSVMTKDAKTRAVKKAQVLADAWLLPEGRTKRRVAHAVPLSKLALSLIASAPKLKEEDGAEIDHDHVLPSGRRGDKPVSGWSRYKDQLDREIGRLIAEEAGEEYDKDRHKFAEEWTIHDLRRTCATRLEMEPISVSRSVVSRVLNHAEGDGTGGKKSQTATYTRYAFDKEAAAALEAWAEELGRIVGENVVPMKRKGA
jgi:integrase